MFYLVPESCVNKSFKNCLVTVSGQRSGAAKLERQTRTLHIRFGHLLTRCLLLFFFFSVDLNAFAAASSSPNRVRRKSCEFMLIPFNKVCRALQ